MQPTPSSEGPAGGTAFVVHWAVSAIALVVGALLLVVGPVMLGIVFVAYAVYRIAYLLGYARLRRKDRTHQVLDGRIPITHQAPNEVEWEQSLIGIEPNSGEIGPPPIC